MNLLADQSFPASVELNALTDLRVWRWSNEGLTDTELLEAANGDFSGVIFLGTAPLHSSELRNQARRLGLALIGTAEADPVVAATSLGLNLHALSRLVTPGALLAVYAREVRPFHV